MIELLNFFSASIYLSEESCKLMFVNPESLLLYNYFLYFILLTFFGYEQIY